MKKIHTFVVLAYKESIYLEECIKSVLNQKYKSDVVLATSTPNKFIKEMARKYKLKVYENIPKQGIGADFDFAAQCGDTVLTTIAHQDDIYDYEYSYNIVKEYNKHKDASILFTDYYEMKNGDNIYSNNNLRVKRLLMTPVKIKLISKYRFIKRLVLCLGSPICCPAVTFNKKVVKFPVFNCNFKCDVDWNAWENISKQNGRFIYIKKKIMGHRIHEDSTTTEIIHDHIRTNEDLEMFKRFWPCWLAKIINKLYVKSEISNKIKSEVK